MRITEREVLHIAKLAEVEVPPADVGRLVEQLDAIVSYVAQLEELGVDSSSAQFLAGPSASPLRADEIRSGRLVRPPSEFAPDFRDGFFVVPRLEAMGGE